MQRVQKVFKFISKLPKQQQYFCATTNQTEFVNYNDRMIQKSENPNGQVYVQNGQIVHFSHLENQKQESLFKIASTTHTDTDVIILSVKENVSLGLQSKVQNKYIENVETIKGDLEIKLDLDSINRQIINYKGKNLISKQEQTQQLNDKNINLKIFKQNKIKNNRKLNKIQCFTGNLAVDFTQPIARGHFTLLKGAPRAGKSRFMAQTLMNHIQESNKYIHGQSKNGTYGIYCASDIHQAREIHKLLIENECDQFTIYSQDTGNLYDNFFLPFTALQQANYLRQELKKDVVFMFDDAYHHFFNELNIFAEVQQPFSPISIVKELFTSTGSFQDQGSLTTFIALDENNYKLELSKEAIKFEQECESLSDNIINFNLKERLTLPRLKYQVQEKIHKEIYQNPLHHGLQTLLLQILKQLEDQKYSIDMKKQLGIEIEPWDYYLYNDSKYFQKLLVNGGYYKPVEQIVLMSFIIRTMQEEVSSQFKDTQKKLIESFFEFCEDFRDFEDDNNIFEYIDILLSRNQPEFVLEHCNRMYELFIMNLQMNDRLHPNKKDYLI